MSTGLSPSSSDSEQWRRLSEGIAPALSESGLVEWIAEDLEMMEVELASFGSRGTVSQRRSKSPAEMA